MQASKIFLRLSIIFGTLFLICLFLVFDSEKPGWEHNKAAYISLVANGVLCTSYIVRYVAIKKQEDNV